MLSDLGQEWKENLMNFDDWTKGRSETKNVHLGRKHGAYGKDDNEAAHIDMLMDGAEDFRTKYVGMIYQNYDAGKDKYIEELLIASQV
ncbi:hypothetical protein AAFF_G00115130 [Aldrovandia affinis]|uniref:Uncharacterized protein n=1 Tax=Aldrovandia affinis TaxID=143900 RepID=A0AAD7VWM1_9TELE|nr:hypothetical protein AAFF_G00115130 [Aldrovandia affinis]